MLGKRKSNFKRSISKIFMSGKADAIKEFHFLSAERSIDYVNILVCSMFCFKAILSAFNNTLRVIFGQTYKLDTLFLYGVLFLIAFNAVPAILKSIKKTDIILAYALIAVFSLSMISEYNNMVIYRSVLKDIMFICLPAYVIGISIKDYSGLGKSLKSVAYIILICKIYTTFILDISFIKTSNYSQNFGYSIMPAAIILIASLFNKFKVIDFIGLIASVSLVVMGGARGPLVCCGLFFVLMLVLKIKHITPKNAKIIGAVLTIGAVTILNIKKIAGFLYEIFEDFNISTRILVLLKNGTLLADKARKKLVECAVNFISSHIFSGSGLVNDRMILNSELAFSNNAIGMYPHNIFLEILMQFGALFGGILILLLILLIIKSLFMNKNSNAKNIFAVFLGVGLFPLFFSGSYLTAEYFYIFLGFGIGYLRNIQHEKNVN